MSTPHEMFFGTKPDVRSLRTFGCEVYCRKQPTALTKLGERSERSIFMGREPGTKIWRVLLENGGIVIRHNCVFVETVVEDEDSDSEMETDSNGGSGMSAAGESESGDDAAAADNADDESDEGEAAQEIRRDVEVPNNRVLPPRTREPSKRLRDAYAMMAKVDTSKDEPAMLEQALSQEDGDLWRQAADDEMRSLSELGVYELVEKPKGVNLLKSK